MKKEMLKGFTMVMLIVAIALATAVASANAQSATAVVADVPFEFVVGDKTMSSGEYTMRSANTPALIIRSADAKSAAISLTIAIEPKKNKDHARLVFHRYGQRYFLAEVWTGANSDGRQLLKSRQERAIERELASLASKSELAESAYETVVLLAVLR